MTAFETPSFTTRELEYRQEERYDGTLRLSKTAR
jgi:hypothetical protein